MELTKEENRLLRVVRKAVSYDKDGIPIKDAIEHDEVIAALYLLVKLTKAPSKPKPDPGAVGRLSN